MSFTPRSRFSSDSDRSPTVAAIVVTTPSTTPAHHGPSNTSSIRAVPTTTVRVTDPANPSQVLFGLTEGAIARLPNSTPVTYPPRSLETTSTMNASTAHGPPGWCSISTTKPAMNGM